MKAKLEVLVRIRPKKGDSEVGVIPRDNQTVAIQNRTGDQTVYSFARVYDQKTSQETIYQG